ncbi:MAG: hypothetical protein H6711_32115 [Myxococcales bacterium]|nr:hypothetical protein [Myxococcales bacterium]
MIRRHFLLGWATLAVAALFGLAIEAMHGLKLGYYLDLDNATRRHMWTLAHAHGSLLGLVHVGVAATLRALPAIADAAAGRWGLRLLIVAALAMPLGFFLGGVWFYGGDPGVGILLVPLGGAALVVGLVLLLWGAWRSPAAGP